MRFTIIILYSLIILISISIISAISYNISFNTSEKQEIDNVFQITSQIANNLSIYFQECITKINLFRNDKQLKENIQKLNEDISENDRVKYVKSINEKMSQVIIFNNDIKDIIILSDSFNNSSKHNKGINYNSNHNQGVNYNSNIIKNIIEDSKNMSKYDVQFLSISEKDYLYGGENQQNMLVYFPIKEANGKDTIATVVYSLEFDKINKICRRNDLAREYSCYLIDENKDLFYAPYADFKFEKDDWNFEKNTTTLKSKEVLSYCKVPSTNWYVGYKIDFSEINDRLLSIKRMTTIVSLVAIISTVSISIFIGYKATKPIKILSKAMKKAEKGDFQTAVEDVSGFEEIDTLYRRYNEMINKIDLLIKEVYTTKLSKQRAEIEALQAKINPHFLNNTLQCITSLAIIERNDDIIYVVDALSHLFDYILYESSDMVPLSKEIGYVQKYIDIQNIRFNNSINLYIKLDEQLNDILVPKLILQPIVENTIQHGFKNKLDKKHVTIEGEFYNNNLILKISDNGNGISKEKCEEILESLEYEKEPVNHIGLYNVNKRLKLNYNQESGIKIESKENYCSIITLIL